MPAVAAPMIRTPDSLSPVRGLTGQGRRSCQRPPKVRSRPGRATDRSAPLAGVVPDPDGSGSTRPLRGLDSPATQVAETDGQHTSYLSESADDGPRIGRIGSPIALMNTSAPGRDRTCDLRFRKPLLYPLSYGSGAQHEPTGDRAVPTARVSGPHRPRSNNQTGTAVRPGRTTTRRRPPAASSPGHRTRTSRGRRRP
jgi:hypothetical protein